VLKIGTKLFGKFKEGGKIKKDNNA